MDGNPRIEEAVVYVSRLTGQSVTADAPIALRSLHRAALGSWARQQNIPLQTQLMAAGNTYSLRELLGDEGRNVAVAPVVARQAAAGSAVGFTGIGIDIEEVTALPEASDYREHPFYRSHFAPVEIAYAVRQPDIRATLCGIWAAKEALFKAGLVVEPEDGMHSVEIMRDALGRPGYPGCQLSISHTPATAVAVCVALAAPAPVPPQPVMPAAPASAAPRSRRKFGRAVALGVVAVMALGAAIVFK